MLNGKVKYVLLIALLLSVVISPAVAASPSDISIYQVDDRATLDAGSETSFKWLIYNDGSDRMLVIPQLDATFPDRISYDLEPSYAVLEPYQGYEFFLNFTAQNDMYSSSIQATITFNVTDMVDLQTEEYEKQFTLDVRSIYGNLDRENKVMGVWDNFLPSPLDGNWGAFGVSILIWMAIAFLVMELLGPILHRFTRRTATKWDDIAIDVMRWPLFLLLLVYGTVSSLEILALAPEMVADLELAYIILVVLIGSLLVYRIIAKVVVCIGKERCRGTASESDDILVNAVELMAKVIVPVAAVFAIAGILGMDLGGMILGVGFLGLVIGYATQSTLSNLFAGIQLMIDRPFKIGDRVPLADGHTSEVVDVGLITTKFRDMDTFEDVIMPNALLESQVITNMNEPDTRFKVNVKVRVSDREDPKRVEDLMMEASRRTPQILQGKNAPVVRVSEVKGGRMLLTIFLWVDDVANRHIARTEYRTNLYNIFRENEMDFALPRNMVWVNRQ